MDYNCYNGTIAGIDYDEPDLNAWFLVSGDMDDFIFYDEPDHGASEK